jgi:hypothetical protein
MLKEVLGFEKRLKRVEDVRVARRRATPHIQERVRLCREAITVQRDMASRDPQRDPDH